MIYYMYENEIKLLENQFILLEAFLHFSVNKTYLLSIQ